MSRLALALVCCVLACPAFAQFQTNQAAADLSIDFLTTDGTFAATTFVGIGGSFTLSTASTSVGFPFDIAFNSAVQANPGIPFAGQLVNLNLAAGLNFVSGGPGLVVPGGFFGGTFWFQQLTLTASAVGDSTFQMYAVDPANPAGVTLSQASTLTVSLSTPLSLGDDDFSQQNLPVPFLFFGVTYNDCFVCSNGMISFGNGVFDFSESVSDFLANEAGIFANWDDFNPGAGGTVFFTTDPSLGTVDIAFVSVPEFVATGANTFNTTIGNGLVTTVYTSIQNADALVGLTPGNSLAAGLAVDLSTAPGSALPLPGGANAPYELFTGAPANDLNGLILNWALDASGFPVVIF